MADTDDRRAPGDTMRDRISGNAIRVWVLMYLDRWILAGGILTIVFLVLVGASLLGDSPLRELVAGHDALWWVFSAFIGAIITGVTLVVTINQLVLSQELGAVGEQRERMEEAMAFRSAAEAHIDEPIGPPEPAAFLGALVEATQERVETVRSAVAAEDDEELTSTVDEFADTIVEQGDAVKANLEGAQFGTFDVLWAVLDFNYSWKIFDARRIRTHHGDALSAEADEAFAELLEVLELFGPAREHFKTLYFQWELIDLSRALLYVSIPTLLVVGGVLFYVGPDSYPGTTLGVDNLALVLSATFTVAISPFVILLVYVLRIGTVAKRTLAIGPFILRETERDADVGAE